MFIMMYISIIVPESCRHCVVKVSGVAEAEVTLQSGDVNVVGCCCDPIAIIRTVTLHTSYNFYFILPALTAHWGAPNGACDVEGNPAILSLR